MCGLFGYVATEAGQSVDVRLLEMYGVMNAARGHHAHGLSQIHNGRLKTYTSPGSFTEQSDCVDWTEGATAVIGHTRYSTSGPAHINDNNQPLQFGQRFAVAHNGTMSNYRRLLTDFQLDNRTDCDSEVIGLIAKQLDAEAREEGRKLKTSTLLKRACNHLESYGHWEGGGWDTATKKQAHGRFIDDAADFAILALAPTRFIAFRSGNPLTFDVWPSGVYFSSLPLTERHSQTQKGLPARVEYVVLSDHRKKLPRKPKPLKVKAPAPPVTPRAYSGAVTTHHTWTTGAAKGKPAHDTIVPGSSEPPPHVDSVDPDTDGITTYHPRGYFKHGLFVTYTMDEMRSLDSYRTACDELGLMSDAFRQHIACMIGHDESPEAEAALMLYLDTVKTIEGF